MTIQNSLEVPSLGKSREPQTLDTGIDNANSPAEDSRGILDTYLQRTAKIFKH